MRSTLSVEYGGGPSILLHNVSSSSRLPLPPRRSTYMSLALPQKEVGSDLSSGAAISCHVLCILPSFQNHIHDIYGGVFLQLSPDQSSVAGALASNPVLMTRISDIYGRDSLGLVTRSIVCCSRIGLGLGLVQQQYNISLPGAEDTM